jgi:hypothetical protein
MGHSVPVSQAKLQTQRGHSQNGIAVKDCMPKGKVLTLAETLRKSDVLDARISPQTLRDMPKSLEFNARDFNVLSGLLNPAIGTIENRSFAELPGSCSPPFPAGSNKYRYVPL